MVIEPQRARHHPSSLTRRSHDRVVGIEEQAFAADLEHVLRTHRPELVILGPDVRSGTALALEGTSRLLGLGVTVIRWNESRPDLLEPLVELWSARPAHFRPPSASLTSREAEVLTYLRRGLRNGDIALALGISVRTVEVHVRSVLKKLGVQTRTQAALADSQSH